MKRFGFHLQRARTFSDKGTHFMENNKLEIYDGLTENFADAKVLYTGQMALLHRQTRVRLTNEIGLIVEIEFTTSSNKDSNVMATFENGLFSVRLDNFGNALGEAMGGRINFVKSSDLEQNRSGTWSYMYTLVCNLIGTTEPVRLVTLTIAEARVL
jgi:hypothetical protein